MPSGMSAVEVPVVKYANGTLTFTYDDESVVNNTDVFGMSDPDLTLWIAAVPSMQRDKYQQNQNTETVVFAPSFRSYTPTSTEGWFKSLVNLKSIRGLENLNTSAVTSMRDMFAGCQRIESLDLSTFDTSNVTDMKSMFQNCQALKSLNISSFNTSNVTNMNSMFFSCISLESIDVSRFVTSKVTDMSEMFRLCRSLKVLDVSMFDTSSLKDSYRMASECFGLKELNIGSNYSFISTTRDNMLNTGTENNPCLLFAANDFDWSQLGPEKKNYNGRPYHEFQNGYFMRGVLLDENSTVAPESISETVSAKVLRKMKRGNVSTICLPFDMDYNQVDATFGYESTVYVFSGCKYTYTPSVDRPTSVRLLFNEYDYKTNGLKANTPYVIKPTSDVDNFYAENITLTPSRTPRTVIIEDVDVEPSIFVGNYTKTVVPEQMIFVADNAFWYSTGKTTMKAFRAYFKLPYTIASYYDEGASAKIQFSLGETTGIDSIMNGKNSDDNKVYTIDGRLVSANGAANLPKGVYISGGKKFVVK